MMETKNPSPSGEPTPKAANVPAQAPDLEKLAGLVYVPEAYATRAASPPPQDTITQAFRWAEESRRDADRW